MKSVKTKAIALGICVVFLVAMGGVFTSSATSFSSGAATDAKLTEAAKGGICLENSHTGTWTVNLDLYAGLLWLGTTEGPGGPGKFYDTIGVQLGDLMILTAVRPGWDTAWWITDTARWDFGTMTAVGSWMNDNPDSGTGIRWWLCTSSPSTLEPSDSTGDMDI